jgi:hypothetical protein
MGQKPWRSLLLVFAQGGAQAGKRESAAVEENSSLIRSGSRLGYHRWAFQST